MEIAAGTEIAGHRIERVIGRGGMGVVYLALQLALDRPVALKVIAPGLAQDEDFRERFKRESRTAAAIGRIRFHLRQVAENLLIDEITITPN